MNDEAREHFEDFTDGEIEYESATPWKYVDVISGPLVDGYLTWFGDTGRSINAEVAGEQGTVEYRMKYPLRNDTVNESQDENSLESDAALSMRGWKVTWVHDDTVYGVGAIHPRAASDSDTTHVESVLGEVSGTSVNLDINPPLYSSVFSLIAAVGAEDEPHQEE